MMEAFTRGPVKLDAKPGGKFALFNGNIFGEFIEIVRQTNWGKIRSNLFVFLRRKTRKSSSTGKISRGPAMQGPLLNSVLMKSLKAPQLFSSIVAFQTGILSAAKLKPDLMNKFSLQ
jgi:hypothetical protein